MLTIFEIRKKAREMTGMEQDYLVRCLEFFEPHCPHLQKVDWRNLSFKWSDAFFCKNDRNHVPGVLGAFDYSTRCIYLAQMFDYMTILPPLEVLQVRMPAIAAVAVHELMHAFQRQTYGALLYALLALPGLREFTIEPAARKTEDACYDLIELGLSESLLITNH